MNISIFGASGATGVILTRRCLDSGHTVKVLARNPADFQFANRVQVVTGDAKDPAAVRQTVEGSEVVLSALGARSLKREEILEVAIPLIVDAMQQLNVRRIIALGSAGALPNSLDKQPAYRRWIVQNIVYNTFLKWPVASQIAQYAALSASNLDWTMVMPPMLTNAPARGTYRIDPDALPRNGSRISRTDVANFMMQQIGSSPQWVRKGVYIAY
jgi:putative NADH-flavin reductase